MTILFDKTFGVGPNGISTAWDSPMRTFEMHQSQLDRLVGLCAKQVEFEFVQGIKSGRTASTIQMLSGLAAHSVVETVFGKPIPSVDRVVSEKWDTIVDPALGLDDNMQKLYDEYSTNALTAIDYVMYNLDPAKTLSERQFVIPDLRNVSPNLAEIDPRWKAVGTMDLVELDDVNGTARIIDMKFRERSQYQRNKASSQSAMYGLAAMYYGYEPTFTYVEIIKGRVVEQEIPITPEKLEWFYIKLRQGIGFIESKFFPINPNGWHCSKKYCGYWDVCRGKYEPASDEEPQNY